MVITDTRPPHPALAKLTNNPYLQCCNSESEAYVDVFVENVLGLYQDPYHRRHHARHTLFHVLENIFQPLDTNDASERKDMIYLKKLDTGYRYWST